MDGLVRYEDCSKLDSNSNNNSNRRKHYRLVITCGFLEVLSHVFIGPSFVIQHFCPTVVVVRITWVRTTWNFLYSSLHGPSIINIHFHILQLSYLGHTSCSSTHWSRPTSFPLANCIADKYNRMKAWLIDDPSRFQLHIFLTKVKTDKSCSISNSTLLFIARQAFFCGTVWYCQS